MFAKAFWFGGLLVVAGAAVLLTVQPAQATPPGDYYPGGYNNYRPSNGGYQTRYRPYDGGYRNPHPTFGGRAGQISRYGRPNPDYGGYGGYYYGGYRFYYPYYAYPYYRR